MLGQLIQKYRAISAELHTSKLYDENTFYKAFLKDLVKRRNEVIIESPFITCRRLVSILPVLIKLKARGVRVFVVTKDPRDNGAGILCNDSTEAISLLQKAGVQVIFIDALHRKRALLDNAITYEGSLNILSQRQSKEFMRRIVSKIVAENMKRFIGANNY